MEGGGWRVESGEGRRDEGGRRKLPIVLGDAGYLKDMPTFGGRKERRRGGRREEGGGRKG